MRTILPGASWQRCRVHLARNVTSRLGSRHSKPVNAVISTIFAQTTPEAVTACYHQVAESLSGPFPDIAAMLDAAEPDLTAFAAMPCEHWPKIWPNNPIERLDREIKRRADVVQVFPDPSSVPRLVGAVLLEQHEEWQYGERRYLSEPSMRRLLHTPTRPTEPLLLAARKSTKKSTRDPTTKKDLTCPQLWTQRIRGLKINRTCLLAKPPPIPRPGEEHDLGGTSRGRLQHPPATRPLRPTPRPGTG